MFGTFIVMAAIEVSLFVDKPNARLFAATILVFGLILRGLATERAEKKALTAAVANGAKKGEVSPLAFDQSLSETTGPPMLCAVRGIGRTLDFAIQEAKDTDRPLYILFVREQPVIAPDDRKRKWIEDEEARQAEDKGRLQQQGHCADLAIPPPPQSRSLAPVAMGFDSNSATGSHSHRAQPTITIREKPSLKWGVSSMLS